MVNFRFHLISLTAVFFALAVGIGIGASVVSQGTVGTLNKRLDAVERNRDKTNAENDRLIDRERVWNRFADQAGDDLLTGRLAGVSIMVVGVQGIDRKPVDSLRQAVQKAGGRLEGTVWFTSKLKLDKPQDIQALKGILGADTSRADTLRRTLETRLAAAWAKAEPNLLPALREAAFIEFEAPSGDPVDLQTLPSPGTRVVVVSGRTPDVPNEALAIPFTTELAKDGANRVLAVEAGRDATEDKPAERALFVGPLRRNGEVKGRLSTVDDLEHWRGRVAAVLALAALGDLKTGHFGVGPGADRLLPELSAPPS